MPQVASPTPLTHINDDDVYVYDTETLVVERVIPCCYRVDCKVALHSQPAGKAAVRGMSARFLGLLETH